MDSCLVEYGVDSGGNVLRVDDALIELFDALCPEIG